MASNTDSRAYLNADIPITTASAERLGRLEFVQLLSRRVLAYRGDRALVVGVCGQWGSGKTSIVNLLVNEVQAARSSARRPVLEPVSFTPWLLGSRDDLAQGLLREVGGRVGAGGDASGVAAELGASIVEVGTALSVAGTLAHSGAPAWLSGVVGGIGIAARARDVAKRMLRRRTAPTLKEAKDKVAAKLREADALLVVALDDLERLPADQIQAVFRVVSAVADFPNTVYVLSMDRHRVANALDGEYGDGHAYLEKFLNLTFDVPTPDPDLLGAMFVEELNSVLSARQVEPDAKRFGAVWHVGLKGVIRTPRDVVRVMNSFDMALEAIGSETDPVDLLALEAMRVLEPGVHQALAANPFAVLRGTKDRLFLMGVRNDKERAEKGEADFEVALNAASDDGRAAAKRLLEVIFPAVHRGGHVEQASVHRARQAASVDHFEHYFRWSMATGALSEAGLFREFEDLVQATQDAELGKWLARNDDRFTYLGEKLSHYVDQAGDRERHYDLAAGLLRAGHLLDDHGSLFVIRSKHLTAISLAYHLVRHAPEGWDSELWRRCAETSWLYGLTHMLAMHCVPDRKDRLQDLPVPTVETRDSLSKAVGGHLEAGCYDDHPALASFLYRWRDVEGDATPARNWVQRKVAARDPVVWSMIDPLMNISHMVETFGDHHRSLNRQNLDGLFDADALRNYVKIVPHPRKADGDAIVAAARRALDTHSEQ